MALKVNINWQQLEKIPLKTKVAVLAGILILIAGLFFYFAYLPQTKEITQLQGQLAQVQRTYNEKKAIADNLPTFQEEVRRLNERFSLALAKLPNSSDIDKILIDVPNLAKEEDLIVGAFTPGHETASGFYATVPFSLQLSGKYNSLAKFFEKVGRLNRIIAIGDITLTGKSGAKDAGSPTLSASVQAKTYRFIDKPKEPKKK